MSGPGRLSQRLSLVSAGIRAVRNVRLAATVTACSPATLNLQCYQ
jgi:hypothetical protein